MTGLILQTKLQPPPLRDKILRRPRLTNLLRDHQGKKLVLICADAGYGKTTLLAQFCAELRHPYMFYDLEPADNDLSTFFNYLVAGIRRYDAGFGQRMAGVIPQTRNIEILAGTFINEFIERIKDEFYVILDDYHHLQQNREVGRALDYLLHHLPENLHLIISSRSVPPLDLAYYYAKQELFRIEREQLRFNLKENQALLMEVYDLDVPDAEIDRIEKHSEGWITAIQLILQKIAALGGEKTRETLNGYIASGEEVFNYFAREVFEAQPAKVQDFLMKTSILEVMDSRLCDCLLGGAGSSRILAGLESEHVFITRVGDGAYRYHPIFQEFLGRRLSYSVPPAKIRRLHYRAGGGFEARGDYLPAAMHYLNGEFYDRAAAILINRQSTMPPETLYRLAGIIDRIRLSVIDRYPGLILVQSKYLSYLARWEDARQVAGRALRIFRRQNDRPGTCDALQQIGFIQLVMMQPREALKCARQAYLLTGTRQHAARAKIMVLLGHINRALARNDVAEDFLNRALDIARRENYAGLKLEALKGIARVYSEKTDFGAAVSVFSEIFSLYEKNPTGLAYANLCANAAAMDIEICDFDGAARLLEQAEKLVRLYNDRRSIAYLAGIRGKYHFYRNEPGKAAEYYQTALKLNRDLREKLIDLYARIDLAYIQLKLKRTEEAKTLLKQVEKLISGQIPRAILIDWHIINGQIARIERDFQTAEKHYRSALKIAAGQDRPYDAMRIRYFLAQLGLDAGRAGQFAENIRRCLAQAQENNYDFFLVKEAGENPELFETAAGREISRDYLTRILQRAGGPGAKGLLDRLRVPGSEHDLEAGVFGRLEVKNRRGETFPVRWPTRKAKELFVYFILRQGDLIDKNLLREILWPGKNLAEATHSLHDHIFFVRSVFRCLLGREARSRDIIRYRNPFYSLTNDIRIKLDLRDFEAFAKKGAGLEPSDAEGAMEWYRKALDLYRGEFVPELYENWAEERRSLCNGEAAKLIKKLAGYHYGRQDHRESLRLYRLGLGYSRLDEEIHVGIMRCLAGLSDRPGIKKQYREMKSLLKVNLGIAPDSKTQRIYHELLGD